jgi:hypothetical protein
MATDENDDEAVEDALGLIMIGSVDLARQSYPPTVFNQALRQARLLGQVEDSVPEEPE